MYQLLVSGNQQHVEEQSWVLHLLAAGLRGPPDAQLYRSAHVGVSTKEPVSSLPCPALSCPVLNWWHTDHCKYCMSCPLTACALALPSP